MPIRSFGKVSLISGEITTWVRFDAGNGHKVRIAFDSANQPMACSGGMAIEDGMFALNLLLKQHGKTLADILS
jgi:hypothetical protein